MTQPYVLTIPQTNYIVTNTTTYSITTLTIRSIVDSLSNQTVIARVKEIPQPLVLWQGDSYVAIGNWTQEQANNQIIALVTGATQS